MIRTSKNNRENYPRNFFWTQENETRVKFNPGLSANQPSNNWAFYSFGSTNDSPASIKRLNTPTSSSLFIIRLPSGLNLFAVSVKSGTKISPSTPGSSRFPMRRLWGRGWDLSSDFPEVFEFPTIYDCISSRHFSIFERRTSMQPEVELFPFLIWNRIRAYWKSREAQITKNSEGYTFPRGNYKQKSFTWL